MSFLQMFFLAIIQGITEFLPISSSAHLVLFQKFFNIEHPPILFDISLHFGTLGAIIYYFRRKLFLIIKEVKLRKILYTILIGCIPTGVAGLILQRYIFQIFNSLKLTGFAMLFSSGLLFFSKRFKLLKRHFDSLNWRDAIFVGCFQALAIVPGISRSGATIVSSLWRKFDQKSAFQFSFFLAIPTIIGAMGLQIPELVHSSLDYVIQGFMGMILAGVVGYNVLRILEKILLRAKLWFFGIYCLVLGIVILLLE